jgi:uncharacterized protein YjbI with pentapeptide repeats
MPRAPVEIVAVNAVSCGSTLWRMDGALRLTIVVKATFSLVPEGPARLVAPAELVTRDLHYRQDPAHSVDAPSDMAPLTARAGVVLVGHAYAPGGRPVEAVAARLGIARERPLLDKTIHVIGDRSPARPGHVAPFQRMPLTYERAFGGPAHDANPVGTGAIPGSPLPNLVHPDDPLRSTGFGPIAAGWSARRGLLDRDARARLDQEVPDLVTGFPFGSLQPAPFDQQLDALLGDEWIVLDGLHPVLPRVHTRLPSARALAVAALGDGERQPVDLAADLLSIHADAQVCSLVWRGHVLLSSEADLGALRVHAGVEIDGRAIEWPGARRAPTMPVPRGASGEGDPERTAFLDVSAVRALHGALPFGEGLGEPALQATPPAAAVRPAAERSSDDAATAVISIAELQAASRQRATPFASEPAAGAPPPVEPVAPIAPPAPVPFGGAPPSPWASGVPAELAAPRTPEAPPPPALQPLPVSAQAYEPPPRVEPDLPAASATGGRDARIDAAPPAPPAPPAPTREPPTRDEKAAVPIVNATPLVVVTVPWQVRPPKDSLTVIVKGTFDLVPRGPAVLRAECSFPTGDLHVDDDLKKGLRYASDLAVWKPRADVTLTGTAHAPKSAGPASAAAQIAFHFGAGPRGFARRIAVLGDRRWHTTLIAVAPTDPIPFATMPLTWEHAFGGSSFDANPVGAGHRGNPGADGVPRLPNLEDPSHLVKSPGDTPAPACFAPIAPAWRERWDKLGTYDRRWLKQRWPYFPEDFSWDFCQAAPRTQQLPYLAGDEAFSLVGMRPDAPRFDGRLPGIRVRCFLQMTKEAGGAFRELPLVLDTAAFDADALALELVWRAFVEVSEEEAPEIDAIFVAKEELASPPMSLAEVRAAYVRAATPAPPPKADPEAPAEPPVRAPVATPEADPRPEKESIAAARARVMKELAAAGVPAIAADDAPPAPPAAPDPAAIATSLRAAGASEEEVDEVARAMSAEDPAHADATPTPAAVRARVIEMLAAGDPFDELDLAGADLSDLDFSGRSLVGTVLLGARLARCSFAGARLGGAVLARADLTDAVLDDADLALALFAEAEAPGASFRRATIEGTDFTGANLHEAAFDEAHGAGVQLARARLTRAKLEGVSLESADFTGGNLDGASFDGASLAEVRLYEATAHGASFRGAAMKGARAEGLRAKKAIFANIVAPGSVWESARLHEASFHGAELPGASFARATCTAVIFSTADLTEARFRKAKLGGAAFLRANLMAATFESADLRRADLRGANLHAAETWKAKLDEANLDHAIVTASKLA